MAKKILKNRSQITSTLRNELHANLRVLSTITGVPISKLLDQAVELLLIHKNAGEVDIEQQITFNKEIMKIMETISEGEIDLELQRAPRNKRYSKHIVEGGRDTDTHQHDVISYPDKLEEGESNKVNRIEDELNTTDDK